MKIQILKYSEYISFIQTVKTFATEIRKSVKTFKQDKMICSTFIDGIRFELVPCIITDQTAGSVM